MEWAIVYRLNDLGILYAVAKFLYHFDGKKYAERMNKSEPGRYFMQLEKVTL